MPRYDRVKESILRAAVAVIPAHRVIVYEVDGSMEPCGHISSWQERHWGDLYRRFVRLDPYHPRHFADNPRSVFGTRQGFCCVRESPDYLVGFRHVVGVSFKAEVFFRDDRGRIRGGMRFARAPGSSEFSRCEMEILEAMQPVFSTAWCTALPLDENHAQTQALSPREHQVLRHALAGQSNAAISRTLGIAMPTTKHHMRSILTKLGASNRRELLSAFYQRRIGALAHTEDVCPH
ncbi:MAG: hypothetical protein KJZ83_06285 [Burkholderiaceae bacterium]|nr:hypothetical protein [Burkholderiaceae bacterium]